MLVSVDIKRLENHLFILENELKETTIIIEILTTMYQTTHHSYDILRSLENIEKEKECISQRIQILKKSIDKFSEWVDIADDQLNEAIEILNFL